MKPNPLKILMLEDSDADAEMIQRQLKKAGLDCDFKVTMTKEVFEPSLRTFKPDIILSDNALPQFSASEALEMVQQYDSDIPFILVTGAVSEEFAAGIIKAGADDYLLKDRLTRLPSAIETALKQKQIEKENKGATLRLRQSEEKYRSMMERVTHGFVALDKNWNYTYINKKAGEILNRRPEELVGKNIWAEFPEGEDKPFYKGYHKAFDTQQYTHFEEYYPPFDLWLDNHIYPSSEGVSIYFSDVTEKKKAEAQINDEREKFAKIAVTSPGLIYSFKLSKDGVFSFPYASNAIYDIFGFNLAEVEHDATQIFNQGDTEEIESVTQSIMESAQNLTPWIHEFQYPHPSKGKIWLHGHSIPSKETDGSTLWHGIISDITQRKDAEQKLIKVNRLYLFISQMNQMIVRMTDKDTLFKEVCQIAVNLGKFRMAWIGIIDNATKKVIPVMHAGEEGEYLSKIKSISIDDSPEGHGPTGTALRQGKYIVCNDIENDPRMDLWKEAALKMEYRSSISVPIKKFGSVIGTFNVYAGEKNFFDASEIDLLEEAAEDISFALEVFEKEALRKKAEEAVAESEMRYHTLTDMAPVGIFHTDAAGITTYVNPQWCRISGLSAKEALGNGWLNAVLKEDKPSLINSWTNATHAASSSLSEYRFVRPDGAIAWVFGQAIPERNADGRIVGYVGTITDITELKEAAKEIEKSNERFELIAKATHDGLWDWNLETGKLWGNEVHQQLYGLTLADPVPNHEDWKSRIHPDDRDRTIKALEIAKASAQSSYTDEYRFYTENEGWMDIYGRTLIERNAEGKPVRLIGSMMDITERKKTEALLAANEKRFRKLVENGNDAFAILNADGNAKYVSSSVHKLLGYTEEEIYKMNMFSIVHPDNIAEVQETMKIVMENPGLPVSGHISRLRHKDGSWHWFEDTITNLLDDPDIMGIVDNFRDVTERIKDQMALKESEEKYRDIVENITDILCTHDLEGKVLSVNLTAQKYLGYEISEMLNMNIQDIMMPRSKEKFGAYLDSIKQTGFAKGLMHVQTRSGVHRIWEFRNSLRKVGIKAPVVYSFAQDVTERIIAEEKLKDKNAQLQTLSDNLPGVMIYQLTGDADGARKFNYVSNGVIQITGKTPEEIIANPNILYDVILKEDLPSLIKAEKESLLNMTVFNVEVRCKTYKNDIRWLNIISTPRQLHGGEIVWDGFHLDVTERRKAEEILRESEETFSKIFYLNPSVCAINDLQSDKFTDVNEAFSKYFGFNKDEVIGKTSVELGILRTEDRNAALSKMDEHGIAHNIESVVWTKNKEQRDVLLSTSNIYINKKEYAYTVLNDITERKRAEEAIKESEEKYRTLVEQASDGIFIADDTGKFIIVNSSAVKLSGYTAEELNKLTIYNLVHPENLAANPFRFDEMMKPQGARSERKMICKDGTVLDVEVSAKFLSDKRFIAFIRDIGDRLKAEAAIKASEEKYRSLVEQASDGIIISDKDGRFITVNPSACKISQFDEKELLQMNIFDFFIDEDIQEKPLQFDALKEGKTITSERKMKRKDGGVNHLEITAKLLTDGKLLSFVRDISERIKAQNEIIKEKNLSDSIINSLPASFFMINTKGKILRWNRHLETASLYNAEEVSNMHPFDFFDEKDKDMLSQKIANAFLTGEDSMEATVCLKTKERLPYYFKGIAIEYDGEPCIMGVGIDISERVRAQEEIKQTSEKLRELTAHLLSIREEERKRIGREIHDELGQQLTAIKMDVSWIDKKTPDETGLIKSKLKNVITLLDGSNQSIRRILSELRPGILDDYGLIEALEWQNRQFTSNTGIAVEFVTTERELKLPESLATCIFRVYQEAFTNITRHAGASKVAASLAIINSYITVAIEDNGNGFAISSVQGKKSFGILGMKERVLAQGGDFELTSVLGKGTKMTIRMPLTNNKNILN